MTVTKIWSWSQMRLDLTGRLTVGRNVTLALSGVKRWEDFLVFLEKIGHQNIKVIIKFHLHMSL
jgi:hypothetical protein